MLPDSPRDRLEWAITECLVVFGIFAFWTGIAVVASIATTLLVPVLFLVGPDAATPDLVWLTDGLWTAVVPLTIVTSSLYVLVRAGELLIDHYRRPVAERESVSSGAPE